MGGLLSDIGGAIEGLGSIFGLGGESAASQAQNAAKQQAYNDQITKAEEEIRAQTNLTEQEKTNRYTEGEQRVAEGASGFDVASGSTLDAQFSQFASDQFKDNVAVFNGMVNAQADQGAAAAALTQGAVTSAGATQSAVAGDVSMAATIAEFIW